MRNNLASVFAVVMCLAWWHSQAEAKVGWSPADIVLDFGMDIEPGDRQVIVTQAEVGHFFHVDIIWRLNPDDCLIQILPGGEERAQAIWQTIGDDLLFKGNPAHADAGNIQSLAIKAQEGKPCRMNAKLDEFIVVSETDRVNEQQTSDSAPLGATVMIFRATSFYTPQEVTITAGERVVWIYADGAKEPHTVTSGACRGTDCSGGGKAFDSGKTLNIAGHRFEHVFKHPGTFPYHCDLHNASMVGTVSVKPKLPSE